MKREICLLLSGAMLLSLLTACGSSTGTTDSDAAAAGTTSISAIDTSEAGAERTDDQEEATVSGQDLDDGAYPMTFENYGREVTVTGKPEKVLTLGPNCTELFAALGLADHVIGRSLVNYSRGPLDEYVEVINAIPELNHASVTREAIISSGADFIYALDWEISETGCNIEEAAQYGMTVYVNSAVTLDEQYQEIRDLGKIFGIEDVAGQYVADQQSRIEAVQEAIAGQEPVTVLVYDSGNNGVFTCSGSNFESLLVGLAGGRNLFDDLTDRQWVTVSYEEVLARNPDVILIHDYDSPSVEEKIAEIKNNPTLAQLECVQKERFATITLESILPGNRMAYAVESMAAAFYPGVFDNETNEFEE